MKPPPFWMRWGSACPMLSAMLLVRIAAEKALPFEPLTPNQETIDVIKAARRGELVMAGPPDALIVSLNEDLLNIRPGSGAIIAGKRQAGMGGPSIRIWPRPRGCWLTTRCSRAAISITALVGELRDCRDCHIRPVPDPDRPQARRHEPRTGAARFTQRVGAVIIAIASRCARLPRRKAAAWFAEVPELPGVRSDSDTPQQALDNVMDAIACWVEAAEEDGRAVPSPIGADAT